MKIQWNDAEDDDLVRIEIRLMTVNVVALEARLFATNARADGRLAPVNAPSWMSDDVRPIDGTVKLLQRGGTGRQRREPQGWQVNVEDPVWGYVIDPGRQHDFANSGSKCGRIPSFIGPCFSEPIPNTPQCSGCGIDPG